MESIMKCSRQKLIDKTNTLLASFHEPELEPAEEKIALAAYLDIKGGSARKMATLITALLTAILALAALFLDNLGDPSEYGMRVVLGIAAMVLVGIAFLSLDAGKYEAAAASVLRYRGR